MKRVFTAAEKAVIKWLWDNRKSFQPPKSVFDYWDSIPKELLKSVDGVFEDYIFGELGVFAKRPRFSSVMKHLEDG